MTDYQETTVLDPPPGFRDTALLHDISEHLAGHMTTVIQYNSTSYMLLEGPIEHRDRFLGPAYPIADELFNIEIEGGQVWLTHPKWSLMGVGPNLLMAEQNLVEEAQIIGDLYLDPPVEDFDYEALSLREFLFNLLY